MTPLARTTWFLALVTSCASAPPRASDRPPPPPRPAASAAPLEKGKIPPGAEGDAQARVADFLARVAEVRHLLPHASVEARVLDRVALIASVRDHVAREIPPDVIRNQGELLVGFGLVPPDYDYQEGAFRLLEAQLAGFYEPHDKKMYLASDLLGRAADATLAHELVHALQDQHYDLGRRLSYQQGANDRESALQALAEGDATSAMMDLLFKDARRRAVDVPDDVFAAEVRSSMTDPSDHGGAPRVLRASLIAPYVDGVMFVHALRRRSLGKGGGQADDGGWSAVDEAWHTPPVTTEQLLHLDKYDAHEPADVVAVPRAPAPGWTVSYDDVFGEEGLRVAVEEWLDPVTAVRVSGGWAGDRAALYRDPGGSSEPGGSRTGRPGPGPGRTGAPLAAAWQIRFDPAAKGAKDVDAEAREAFDALSEAIRPGRRATTSVCIERATLGPLSVVRAGRDIVIVAGPYRRDGNRVVSDSVCTKSLRWAADILSKRQR